MSDVQRINALFERAVQEATAWWANPPDDDAVRRRGPLTPRQMALTQMVGTFKMLTVLSAGGRLDPEEGKRLAFFGIAHATRDEILALDHSSPDYQAYVGELNVLLMGLRDEKPS